MNQTDSNIFFYLPIEVWAIIGPIAGVIIGGIIGAGTSWFSSAKRINADLKAKTRLEWIKEVRELTANIISGMFELLILNGKHSEIKDIEGRLSDEYIFQFQIESSKISNEIYKNLTLYKLYFSRITLSEGKLKRSFSKRKNEGQYKENKENKEMHDLADSIYDQMKNLILEILRDETALYNPDKIIEFRDETSDYLKKEWDKAKDNK